MSPIRPLKAVDSASGDMIFLLLHVIGECGPEVHDEFFSSYGPKQPRRPHSDGCPTEPDVEVFDFQFQVPLLGLSSSDSREVCCPPLGRLPFEFRPACGCVPTCDRGRFARRSVLVASRTMSVFVLVS